MSLLVENEKSLNKKQAEFEKELNEKTKDIKVQIVPPPAQTSADSVTQNMSQVSLRDIEIVGLKNQNKNLENATLKKEEERKAWENKCKVISDKNDKLMKQVT